MENELNKKTISLIDKLSSVVDNRIKILNEEKNVQDKICCGTCYWNNDGMCDNVNICLDEFTYWKQQIEGECE